VTSGCLARQEIGRRRRIQIITVVAPATPACEGRDDVAVLRAARRTALVGGLVLCAAVGPLAGPGRADALQPPAVSASWYWAERAPLVAGMQAPTLPEQAAMAADVPAGDLGVGYVNSNLAPADKVAAVGFDLTAIAMGSTFSRFTVTVPVDAGATQVQTAQPDLVACENIDAFVDGTAGGPLAEAPPVSDPSCVKGVFDAGKGYVFDLTTMANDWSFGAPSLGITLKPLTPSTTTPLFSVVLKGKNSITTQAAFTGPAPAQQAPDPAGGGGGPPAPPPPLSACWLPTSSSRPPPEPGYSGRPHLSDREEVGLAELGAAKLFAVRNHAGCRFLSQCRLGHPHEGRSFPEPVHRLDHGALQATLTDGRPGVRMLRSTCEYARASSKCGGDHLGGGSSPAGISNR
jgi:hypothetical protein